MSRGYYLPKPGDTIGGRYKIKKYLAKGGFGAVFVAEQIGIGREVAIKTILPQMALSPSYMKRFKLEAHLLKDLISPHTIRLYDFGCTEGNLFYLVMELLKGISLKTMLERGPVDDEKAFQIVKQILKSLTEAHQKGIIHRDLKPENIMLIDIPGEKKEFVKVLDFGIGKTIGNNSKSTNPLTKTGAILGTPNYMAPELLQGKGIGPWSDLYSVGLMLIEFLSGKRAVTGKNAAIIACTQLMSAKVEIPPAIMSSRLIPVIQKATLKQKSQRFQDTEQFLEALEALFSNSNQPIDTPSSPENYPNSELQYVENDENNTEDDAHTIPSTPDDGDNQLDSKAEVEIDLDSIKDFSGPTTTFPSPLPEMPVILKSESLAFSRIPKKHTQLGLLLIIFILLTGIGYILFSSPGSLKEKTDKPTEQSVSDNTADPDSITEVVKEKTENPGTEVAKEKTDAPDNEETKEKTDVPDKVIVKINCEPKGVSVHSDNKELGKTPLELSIPADSKPRKLMFKKKGYYSKTLEITPQQLVINTKLIPLNKTKHDKKTKKSKDKKKAPVLEDW